MVLMTVTGHNYRPMAPIFTPFAKQLAGKNEYKNCFVSSGFYVFFKVFCFLTNDILLASRESFKRYDWELSLVIVSPPVT